jgi:DNA invertase Pin-like site-specific DNA recombinase
MRKYFAYYRCATRKQGQETESIDRQEKTVLGYAKCYNLSIAKVFKDFGSGIDADRPSFKEMIARLENGECNGIICTSIDRLTRNYQTFAQLMKLIDEKDVEIVTPERTYGRTKEDQLALSVMAAFAEFYAKSLAERVRKAKLQKAKQDR